MKQTPLVSIIIPTYNRAHLIGETLDSVIAQTYTNWECIVVDDGSTDNTSELLQGYCNKDARFQYHQRPSNRLKGANACRNYGFELSKGEYINWFDSDDLMFNNKLTTKFEYALKFNADIVISSHTTLVDVQNNDKIEYEIFEKSDFYIDYILGKKPLITDDVLIKRAIIGNFRFDKKLHKAQEFEFFSRLFEQKLKYCFIDIPLTLYKETNDSISNLTSNGNNTQAESLIYLSKKLQKEHSSNNLIVIRAKRQGMKIYKNLAKRRNLKMILKHFSFFKKCYNKNAITFSFFLIYNVTFKRGFDVIKQRKS